MVSTTLLVIIYLSFISLGLPDSLLGSAWPTMVSDLHAPLWGAGLVSMTVSMCTVISSVNSARLIRRFGTGKLAAFSGMLTAAALLGMSVVPHYVFLLLLAIPLGLGAGAVDSAMNNYVALHCQAKHMNWLHCFWGVGTVISPYVMSAVLSLGMKWTAGYRTVSMLQFALSIVLFSTLRLWGGEKAKEEERRSKVLSVRQVLALPGAKQGLLGFTSYCAVEQTFILWSSTYLVMARGLDAATAASLGGRFFIAMTLGRGISGFIAIRLSPRKMVRLGQTMMALGSLLLFVPGRVVGIFGLLFMGLGCAPVYPNIVQDTPRNFGAENSQAVIGVQMAFAYMGSLSMPTVFGWLAEGFGYGVLPVFSLAITVIMILLYNAQQRIVDARNQNA